MADPKVARLAARAAARITTRLNQGVNIRPGFTPGPVFGFDAGNINGLAPAMAKAFAAAEGVAPVVARLVAERFLEQLKANWYGQNVGLLPLSVAYREAKRRKGLDERILIATTELVKRLEVFRPEDETTRKTGRWVAGLKSGTHTPSGLDYVQLMRILEYGSPSRRIPPRPIFMVTRLLMEQELRTLSRRLLTEMIGVG